MSQLEKAHVLVVDDSITIRNSITKYLGEDYFTLEASNGEEAWQLIQSNSSISLVFVDLHMPVMNGMALLKQVSDSDCERISNLPVIMITGHEDSEAAKRASYNMGATDFISKPFTELDILSRAGAYVKLNRKIATLEKNVTHDALTGLFNKSGFQELGERALAGAHRYDYELSMLTMQITNVDEILRKHGKKVTEQIVLTVVKNLKKSLRKEEALAHLGTGQFSILLPMTKIFRAHIVAMRFQKAIASFAFKVANDVIRIKLAVGMNSTEEYEERIKFDQLSSNAEEALLTSIRYRGCEIVRYDAARVNNPYLETVKSPSSKLLSEVGSVKATENNKAASSSDKNVKLIDAEDFTRYLYVILNGDFDKIPKPHLAAMVEPLETFVKYAHSQHAEIEQV